MSFIQQNLSNIKEESNHNPEDMIDAGYPVPKHPTWDIIDSSKIKTFMECPRKYFYEYILGWQLKGTSIHLVFGESWHRALEHCLVNGFDEVAIRDAYNRASLYYREFFGEETDQDNYPKSPDSIIPALVSYGEKYKDDGLTVLDTEISGTVPIAKDRTIHFRLDARCLDDNGQLLILEHKTGSRMAQSWIDQWPLSIQIGTYTHALYCMEESNDIYGVVVNGTIFKKSGIEHVRVPVRMTYEMLGAWLWEVNHQIDMIEWNTEALKESSVEDSIMRAWPRNPGACTNWGRTCPFHDFCQSWANPLKRADEVPIGFKRDWWNPSERESKKVVTLNMKEG